MKRKLWAILPLIILILVLTGCTLPTPLSTSNPGASSPSSFTPGPATEPGTSTRPTPQSLPAGSIPGSVQGLETLLEQIYSQVNPSVVNIQVLTKPLATFPSIPGLLPTPGGSQYAVDLGSGFVRDTTGHIITNNHVVTDAESISITFSDGTIVPADIVGTDPDSDLAVIKVDLPAGPLHPVKLADSSQLKVGQLAVAIGNPFGLQGTMTVGFVSGLGRLLPASTSTLGGSYSIPEIIQTDAPINPGNSGGVLLDNAGDLIGVTTAIASQSGSSAGVGFAIPSAIVQKVAPSLINSGHYDHPWLGVSVTTLTPDLNKAMNLKSDQRGALVRQVMANSPAEKAGLQTSQQSVTINGITVNVGGDVITAFGDKVVKSSDDLVTYLAEFGSIGQTVSLTVFRNGKEMQVPVTLAARPPS